MNFLAELVATADEVNMEDVKQKVPNIISRIERLKSEVMNHMKNTNKEFLLIKNKSSNMLNEANKLNMEMQELSLQTDKLTNKDIQEELINFKSDLQESLFALKLVTQLVEIDDYFNKAKESINQKEYLEAMISINSINDTLKNISTDEKLEIINALDIFAKIEHETILNETKKIWNETVNIEKKVLDDETILSIKINTSRSDELQESVKVLCYNKIFVFQLQCLANFLMNEIFTSVINNQCNVEILNTEIYSILTITVNATQPKQHYIQVFSNIKTIFEFLSVTVNFGIKDDLLLLGFLGQKFSETFLEMFIKNCLADTIPSKFEDLAKFDEVAIEIQVLQDVLVECQFLSKDNESILKYAKNVDVLFANKACEIYVKQAKDILRKDLHDMIEVGTEVNLELTSSNVFPKCFISKNVLEYLELVRQILEQASDSSDICAGKFVYIIDLILENYGKLVPEYHRKLLESIPQQVALFHNNCMYIAHELRTINNNGTEEKINVTLKTDFLNREQFLRSVGTDLFTKYVDTQIKQIEEILKSSELAKLGQTDKMDINCEKSIRQCLRQLELLKTVWQKVLSYEIYNKNIGHLLNSFVEFLIKIVVKVEDISAENSTLLVDIFGIVKTRGPKLFSEPKEINLYVKKWYKFNELILLLNSSLTDINDRWADGKGPLAVEFKSDEIKGLIKALFQNTDRRASILARIN